MSSGGAAAGGGSGGGEALKLSFHFGEHDRHRGRNLSDVVLDLFAERRLAAGVLLRGAEGFGSRHLLQTDRLLSLSEDLPLLAVGVGAAPAVEALAEELSGLAAGGLLALESVRLAADGHRPEDEPHEEVKLSVYGGRGARQGGTPAHVGVVAALHRHGVAGATCFLGVDGAAAGRRLRARFFAANAWVPTVTVAVGERERIAAALAELAAAGEPPLATLEAIRVLRRDGRARAEPRVARSGGLGRAEPGRPGHEWSRLSVYCSERSEHRGHSLYMGLVRRLRAEGAAGATALRGVWGYHGDHRPHGDRLLALRRHVPIVVSAIDAAPRAERWLRIASELTEETGLVTAEPVPTIFTLE